MVLVYPRAADGTFTCPCGASTNDPVSICDGICRVCGQPTGLCPAGRTLIPPQGVQAPSWEVSCPALGIVWWCVKLPTGKSIHPLLCTVHSHQALYEPWIDGIPLEPSGEEVKQVDIQLGIARAALRRAGVAVTAAVVLGIGGAAAMTPSATHAPPAAVHVQASGNGGGDTYYHG